MPTRPSTIFAAILAAGSSSRFGSLKLAANLHGVPLLRHAVEIATEVFGSRVITVVGHERETALKLLQPYAGFVVVNEDYEQGLGTSIATAASASRGRADALILLLADQPLVTAAHLRALMNSWTGADNAIVATAFDDTVGPPVLFPSRAFPALATLSGDQGARALFHDSRFRLHTVRCDAAAVDIDTPQDLLQLT